MATVRKAIFRVKDSSGQYVTTHVQTSADQVLFNDGDNLEQKIEGLKSIGATLIDDSTTGSEKTWSSEKISTEFSQKADSIHTHPLSEVEDWNTHLYNKEEINALVQDVITDLDEVERLIGLVRSDLVLTNENVGTIQTTMEQHEQALIALRDGLAAIDVEKLNALDLEGIETLKTEVVAQKEVLATFKDMVEATFNDLGEKDQALEAGLTRAQTDIQSATDRINSFIEANGSVVSDLTTLKQEVSTVKSNIGNLDSLATEAKHSLVLAMNELANKTSDLLQINDTGAAITSPWSGHKTQNELNNKSDKNHQHGLDSVNDWRTHLYDKTQVDDLLNALALGFTWKAPVDSLDDLPQNPELGWAVIVGGTSLYIYSEEGWIDLGVSSLPPVATQEFDGLLSRIDKAKLDSMDAEKLAQLDLTQFDVLEGKIAQNVEAITNLLAKTGANEEAITSLRQTLTTHQGLLDSIDFEKLEDILLNIDSETIKNLGTELGDLSSSVDGLAIKVSTNEEAIADQEKRLDALNSLPRIYCQTEEPEGAINGSIWIVGE